MKQFLNKIQCSKWFNVMKVLGIQGYILLLSGQPVWASGVDTAQFDNVTKTLFTWVVRIGLVIAAIGGVEFAFAYSNDNAEAKNRALRHMASGFMAAGIAKSLDLFGL